MSKRWIQYLISAVVACVVSYIYIHQPKVMNSLPKEHLIGLMWLMFVLVALCLTLYGHLINAFIVYPVFKTVTPYISPKSAHEAFFYRAFSFYRRYQRGEILLKELAETTLTGEISNEEREAAYVLYALMDMEPAALAGTLAPEKKDLVLTGLEKASKKRLWVRVYAISSMATALALIALVSSISGSKAVLVGFAGMLLKHAASKLA